MVKMPRKQYAANFYSGASEARVRRFLEGFEPPKLSAPPVAGLVPHAGWDFSGAVAAKVFDTIKSYKEPETFVLFGTVHRNIPDSAVYSRGSWLTPFGEVLIDEKLADRLLEQTKGFLERNESAHEHEHSIEVQMPLLKHLFPDSKAVPISVLPDDRAPALGGRVGEFLKKDRTDAIVVGTTDLTHYGDAYLFTPRGHGPEALDWMKRNDARIIELATTLKAEQIVAEAMKSQNACGAGAMAATVAAARALGSSKGETIEYTTSYDVMPERVFRMGVGYAGMIFCGS
ncbi:MAG: AmmeMemoRadiSam system protein B [Candidatus Hydrogenedentota bacterium]|nr:MAG: AmmeMemoRadiSam system protein B [Candidatus Hydrogenedentota bacterium]